MGITCRISDIDSDITLEFSPPENDMVRIVMSVPDNDYAGGIITVATEDLERAIQFIKTTKGKQ